MARFARTPFWLTVCAVGCGAAVTVWATVDPPSGLATRSQATHLVLEAGDGVIAGIVALLVYGRFRRSRARADLLLSLAMAVLGFVGLGFVTIPELSGVGPAHPVTSWAPLLLRVGAAGLLMAGAVLPAGSVVRRQRLYAFVVAALVIAILAAAFLAAHALPVAVQPASDASGAPVVGHPVVAVAQVIDLLFYGVSCAAYTYRAIRTNDEFVAWIGAAAGLGAVARIAYLSAPTLFSEYVSTGDIVRTACYIFLLVGAVREIEHYWTAIATAAALQERQRIACDLHDGLAQELTYIWSQVQELEHHPERRDMVRRRLSSASARAIDEARRAIAALTEPPDQPLSDVLARSAEEVAHRYGIVVDVRVDEHVALSAEVREAAIRIMREAIANSARHSGAGEVTVRLCADGGACLVVSDCGSGFDIAAARTSTGYGLTSMAQRAQASGGSFEVRSSVGGGTTVRVRWP